MLEGLVRAARREDLVIEFQADEAVAPAVASNGLMRLALDILARRHTPPALFIRHQLITPENVNHVYPNDALLGVAAGSPPALSGRPQNPFNAHGLTAMDPG